MNTPETRVDIEVYQCPAHKAFQTLVVGDTRFGASKCCVRQYERRIACWHMRSKEALRLAERLEEEIEEAGSGADSACPLNECDGSGIATSPTRACAHLDPAWPGPGPQRGDGRARPQEDKEGSRGS